MSKKQSQVPRYWFSDAPVPLPMRCLAGIYSGAIALRRWLYARRWLKSKRAGVPVLVVGNLTVGGTGKTPLTIAIVERLHAAGWTPGVASRGYGRAEENTARWVDAQTSPEHGGDEPVLIAKRTGARVRVDRNRAAAAQALVAAGCDIVVCDDGLQHYALARDVEIEVVDAARGYGNGLMLPAGPLREPLTRGQLCDFRVMNQGMNPGEAEFGSWPMLLQVEGAQPMRGGRLRRLSAFSGQRVHAVAGIGNPNRFFDMLREQGIGVVPHAFADHHTFTRADLSFGSELPVLMTEKDAVKCASFANDWHYSVAVTAALPEAFWVALLDRVESLRPQAQVGSKVTNP